MSHTDRNLLLIDDVPSHAQALEEAWIAGGHVRSAFEWVRSLSIGLDRLAHRTAWAIFVNLNLPDSRGINTLEGLLPFASESQVVVIAGANDEEICQAAMSIGARDYLLEGHIDIYAFARAVRNIAERELARHELWAEKERSQVTLNSIGDAVISTDNAGNVTYLNVVAEQMTGWSMKQAVCRPLKEVFQIVDGVTHQPSPNPMELAIRQNKTVGLSANCILIRRDGHECAIEDSAAPIHDRNGLVTGAVIVFHDVSMARDRVMEMSYLAQHDTLTDLPNRSMLRDRVTQAISLALRNDKQLAVLFLDLDGFKRINDSLGHAIGDKLLQSVATRLLSSVRRSDTVSRLGGDEFVILLPEVTHAADAAISAAKILSCLREAHNIGDQRITINASIGISTFPEHGRDTETLIKNADTAMYHAKESGRDNYQFFGSGMSLAGVERESLEGQLRYVLERQELLLHYQPKINLATGAITSAEALLRWQHKERGLLFPEQFLSIAEDSGLIVAIGHWVLREACRQTREWRDAGLLTVPMAVNVSSLEFRNEQFLEGVRVALKNTSLDPSYLELELTEGVLMRHADSTSETLEQLKAIGVRLAVDDFGTGYSSLSYLTQFPVDTLKLDRSFIQNVVTDTDQAVIANAVIVMGKALKLRVVAEGVETLEQLAFLQAHGCDEGQGYYFSPPVTADRFAKFLEIPCQQVIAN